jgi:peptide/nickel transport system permease protein
VLVTILKRVAFGVVTLWAASVLVFSATELLSGNVVTAILGRDATPEAQAIIEDKLELDRPAVSRYLSWLEGILHGDFGESLGEGVGVYAQVTRGHTDVWSIINDKLVNTAILAGVTAVLTIVGAFALGIISALRPGGLLDSILSAVTVSLVAIPEFVVGTVLVLIFAIHWQLLPAVSLIFPEQDTMDHIKALVLPVATLTFIGVTQLARMVRGSMIEALESEYTYMARLRGLPERQVVLRHALRNALGPAIQVTALTIAWLFGGIVIVEVLFNYPGIGAELASAVRGRDVPVVQALALIGASVFIVVNVLADIATILATPKLRTK